MFLFLFVFTVLVSKSGRPQDGLCEECARLAETRLAENTLNHMNIT